MMEQSSCYENLESFKGFVPELCKDNLQCQSNDCKLIHPRCFAGVCIQSLQVNSKSCLKNDNCYLHHFTLNQLKQEYNITSINGVYRFNICNKKNCEGNQNCSFLHVQWTQGICIDNLNGDCEYEDNHDNLQHTSWNKLKTNVQKDYNINNINPENLCLKVNCFCSYHLPNIEQICPLYFKGVCPNKQCIKQHIMWEQYKKSGAKIAKHTIQSCIALNCQPVNLEYEPTQVYLEKAQLLRLTKDLQEKNTIDIIFIMDCTGSMQPWIDQSSKQIYTLIDKFISYIKGQNIVRVAFIGYRDYGDRQKIACMDLTPDVEKIKQFISKQKASGGGDNAEDVIGAIKQAYQLNISRNEESLLITYLFADAPNHGQQYYDQNFTSDNYKDKIKQGSLEELMQKYNKLKTKNYFYCVKINETTQKMYQIMKENFTDLIITQSLKPDQLCQMVSFTLQDTYNKTSSVTLVKNSQRIKALYQRPKSLAYDLDRYQSQEYWKNYVSELEKVLRIGKTQVEINLEEMQFSNNEKGTQCHIFQLKDLKKCRKMLVKIPNFIYDKYQELRNQYQDNPEKIKEITIDDDLTVSKLQGFNKQRFNNLMLAKQLAYVYRQKIKMIQGAPLIFYVTPIIYELDEPFMGIKQLYAETYIDFPNIEWKKYTSNQKFVDEQHKLMTSFSHFTYSETDGEFLVTDLQGKKNLLSDPSIQTKQLNDRSFLKDATNFELQGVATFFKFQHENCSDICSQLGLMHLNDSILNPSLLETQIFQQTDSIKVKPYKKSEKIIIVCEICDEIMDLTIEQYQKLNQIKCDQCIQEENIIDEIQCQCCRKMFKVKYQTDLRIDTVIKICPDCKTHCKPKKQTNKCIYCDIDCSLNVQLMTIDEQNHYICSNAMKYLQAMLCQKCRLAYDFSYLLEKKNYEKGLYTCSKCKNINQK